jgi:hypothetical protein
MEIRMAKKIESNKCVLCNGEFSLFEDQSIASIAKLLAR